MSSPATFVITLTDEKGKIHTYGRLQINRREANRPRLLLSLQNPLSTTPENQIAINPFFEDLEQGTDPETRSSAPQDHREMVFAWVCAVTFMLLSTALAMVLVLLLKEIDRLLSTRGVSGKV